jgi:Tfp pilus assembly protein PilO
MEKREKPKKPTTSKNISMLIMVLAAFIFALGYYFYIKPAADLAAELNSQDVLALEVTLGEKQTRLFTAKKLAKSYENPSEETIKKLNEALPSEPGQVDLYVNINALAEQSGLTVSNLQITVPEEKDVPAALQQPGSVMSSKVRQVIISLSADGMTYTNLKRFIRNIETNSRLLQMDSLTFDPSNSSYAADLMAFYLVN